VDELNPKIHFIEETSAFPHLTQSAYEESLINTQINTPNKYNLRSKRKEGNFDSQDQPLIAERPTKAATTTTKEKKT